MQEMRQSCINLIVQLLPGLKDYWENYTLHLYSGLRRLDLFPVRLPFSMC